MPTSIKPKGGVPKKCKDLHRVIADAREGNKANVDWGTLIFTVSDMASAMSS